MPYRRLPNTDISRLNALKTAFQKGKEIPPFKLAFTQSTFQRVQSFLPSFEKAMIEQKQAYNAQIEKNQEYMNAYKKAKLYISHFIQVMNMAITRNEISPSIRKFYGIEEDQKKVPDLNTENEIIQWGENIIQGEQIRTMKGQSPITNPTIAVVKVRYENFMDAYRFQKTLQKRNTRALNALAELRDEADDIIVKIWNEVEEAFKDMPEELKRENAQKYGLVYVFRKNELSKTDLIQSDKLQFN